jgi:nitronate monooxygenase
MQVGVSVQQGVMDYMGIGRGADADRSFMPAGQGMGLIRQIKPAAEVLADIVSEAEAVLARPPFCHSGSG